MSDMDPAEVSLPGRRPAPDPYDDDLPEAAIESDAPPRRTEREGLPATYRMRADAHYVDQLMSRRHDRVAETRMSGDLDAPAPVRDPGRTEPLQARVLAKLAEDLATIGAAAALLAGDATPLARRLNTDLIRVETWRAAWLLRAQAVIDGSHRSQMRSRRLGSILESLRQGFEPECRVSGITLQVEANDWNTPVLVDEPALVAGLTGAVLATLGLLGRLEGATIKIAVEAGSGEIGIVEVSQEEVSVPTGASLRFFDAAWTDRPGGWLAGMGALAARAAARLHGGNAVLLVADRRGTAIRMTSSRALAPAAGV